MKKIEKLNYYKFLNSLPKKINKLYFLKLKGKFKLNNKSKKKNGFDPVTNIDRAFELFLRKEILKTFPNDGIVGEEFSKRKTKSGFRLAEATKTSTASTRTSRRDLLLVFTGRNP